MDGRDYGIADIRRALGASVGISGFEGATFRRIAPLFEAEGDSLSWVRSERPDKQQLVDRSRCAVLLCDSSIEIAHLDLSDRCIVRVPAPELAFMRVVKALYSAPPVTPGIHPTAVVDPAARIGVGVSIGAFSFVGAAELGDGTIIEHHVNIRSGVVLGRNVRICDHGNLGGQGFGHVKNETGDLENMLHVGKVVLEDEVELFPFSNVDAATLSETRIERGAKIDHYCHIGHNTRVGAAAILAARIVMCGGARIGARCWIGVGTILRDRVVVGDGATLGMGSLATKDVPPGEVWAGVPARPMDELRALQGRLAELAHMRH